ncbi:AfsR/SARP family transcriptional regulator [Geodermatophilus maliterrae]|uniref:BTAD domain-containing putative transcriptional regulator n=1 Tax=Geodermatophilus maliterrae TaxID=3162531 RepID=A0ABV3XA33_9ACTN
MDVRFTVLGRLEVLKDGVDHAPTAPKVLQLMGMLLLRPGRVVHIDSIVEELWGDRPPRSVRTTMQTYVYNVRRCIEENELATDAEAMLATRYPGYLLCISPAQLDATSFQQLCRRGAAEMSEARHADAVRTLRAALELWSGPPLANVPCGPVLSRFVVELEEQRRHAQHLRIEAEMALGAHRELIGDLRTMVAVDRLDEVLHGQLMRVLARSGRRSDAMATYRDLRSRLISELGVEPCDELRALHLELLSDQGRPHAR